MNKNLKFLLHLEKLPLFQEIIFRMVSIRDTFRHQEVFKNKISIQGTLIFLKSQSVLTLANSPQTMV